MSIHLFNLESRRASDLPSLRGLWSPRWSPDGKYIAAITSDSTALRIRISVPAGKLERLADLGDFVQPPDNWFGVAPDGTPLASRAAVTQEIWALKCVLP